MLTKITLKDVVAWVRGWYNMSEDYWGTYCTDCKYKNTLPDNASGIHSRCDNCRPRVAPPTRFRRKK